MHSLQKFIEAGKQESNCWLDRDRTERTLEQNLQGSENNGKYESTNTF